MTDCPDSTYREERPGGCKHQKALQSLRRAGKLPLPTPLPDRHPGASYEPGHSSDLLF